MTNDSSPEGSSHPDETVRGELVPAEPTLPVGRRAPDRESLRDLLNFGKVMATSGYFPDVRSNSAAVVKILAGQELGFSAIASMSGVHIIDGVPTLHARLQAALVRRHPHYDYRIKTHDDVLCIIEFFEIDDDGERTSLGESPYSIDDAKLAGLVKPNSNWTKFPRNMLFARAMTNGIGWYCPDVVSMAVYDPSEINPDIDLDAQGTPREPANDAQQDVEEVEEGEFREVEGVGTVDTATGEVTAPAEEDDAGDEKADDWQPRITTVGDLQSWAETYATDAGVAYTRDKLLHVLGVETIADIARTYRGADGLRAAVEKWREFIEKVSGDSPAEADKLAEAAAVSAVGDRIAGRTDGDDASGTAESPGGEGAPNDS